MLALALFSRYFATVFKTWNLQWDIKDLLTDFPVHIELVDLTVIALGFLLVAVHGIATLETVLCLWRYLTNQQALRRVLSGAASTKLRCLVVVLATLACVVNSFVMIAFVREMWVGSLCIVIQVLHFFPSFADICQALANGLLIYVTPALAVGDGLFTRDDHRRAAAAHRVSTWMHVLYIGLNTAVIINSQAHVLYIVSILLDLIGRIVLVYMLDTVGFMDDNRGFGKDSQLVQSQTDNHPNLLRSVYKPFINQYEFLQDVVFLDLDSEHHF